MSDFYELLNIYIYLICSNNTSNNVQDAPSADYKIFLSKYSNIVIFTFKASCMSIAKLIQKSPDGNLDVATTITSPQLFSCFSKLQALDRAKHTIDSII